MTPPQSFDRVGPAEPGSPVVLSVPHAGRDYPDALHAALAVPSAAVVALEDRYVDAVALAALSDEAGFIQRRARAWIDLNRREDERDPAIDEGAVASVPLTAKLRGGLGLVPRRVGQRDGLWRRRWRAEEIDARIVADHRPYHAALDVALDAARARFGTAVLLDLHSMPRLAGHAPAVVVVGDRHGTTASPRFARRLAGTASAAGLRAARNLPYAGGHVVERHGAPAAGIHALQLELDRSLYLDAQALLPVADKVERTAVFVRAALDALAEEALASPCAVAAE